MPSIDVVFADRGEQRLVAGASFLKRHCERLCERAGDRLRITGIDQQGALEINRSAGEAGQDEDARIVRILSSDIFFRNEIYSIAQWCHQADARCPIKSREADGLLTVWSNAASLYASPRGCCRMTNAPLRNVKIRSGRQTPRCKEPRPGLLPKGL